MKKLVLTGAALVFLTSAASAADLSARHYTKAPAYIAPVYNWTGFYIGGFVGGAFDRNNTYDELSNLTVRPTSKSAFFGGGQVGFNYQFSSNWVVGLEGDIGAVSNSDRVIGSASPDIFIRDRIDWLASVTGRLGYTWGPGLVYAKGGVAFRGDDVISPGFRPYTTTREDTGYTIGGGLEYMFAPAWSAKIEYQYYNFGRTSFTANTGPAVPYLSYKDDLHTVKAGINYHFNWGNPVVASY